MTSALFAGHGGRVADAPVERFCFVAESDELARQQAWTLVVALAGQQRRAGADQRPGRITTEADLEPERFYRETAIVGGPDTVTRRIRGLHEQGIRYVNLRPSFTGICPMPLQRTSVALFARHVMPRTRAGRPANGAREDDGLS